MTETPRTGNSGLLENVAMMVGGGTLGKGVLAGLEACPISEFFKRSFCRKLCDEKGFRDPKMPFSFQLGFVDQGDEKGGVKPKVKTVGFQRIHCEKSSESGELGLDFLVKKGSLSHALKNESKDGVKVSICYVHGIYPPPTPDGKCEQWRFEGVARPVSVDDVLRGGSAPLGSLSQIIVSSQAKPEAFERSPFVQQVQSVREEMKQFSSTALPEHIRKQINTSVQVYRLVPEHVEFMESGELWERVQWIYNPARKSYEEATQVQPY